MGRPSRRGDLPPARSDPARPAGACARTARGHGRLRSAGEHRARGHLLRVMLQLRTVVCCLWWRPSASRPERAVWAGLVAAIGAAWIVLAVMAITAASG